jgi:serine/threonine protein kinase
MLLPPLPKVMHRLPPNVDVLATLEVHLLFPHQTTFANLAGGSHAPHAFSFSQLQSQPKQPRAALIAPANAGASLYAAKIAHQMLEEAKHRFAFWINARTRRTIRESYDAIARETDASATQSHLPIDWNSANDFHHYLSWNFDGNWLVVFDGLEHDSALWLVLQNLIPQGLNGSILFTTSDPSCIKYFNDVKMIELEYSEWVEDVRLEPWYKQDEPSAEDARNVGEIASPSSGKLVSKQSLANELRASLLNSCFDHPDRRFLPHGTIDEIVTRDAIENELREDGTTALSHALAHHLVEIADWVRAEARKVFATTMLCNPSLDQLTTFIALCYDHGYDDKSLPLGDPHSATWQAPEPFRPSRGLQPSADQFYENQWKCLSPVFSAEYYRHNLPMEAILPFIDDKFESKAGAITKVYKLRVHPSHLQSHSLSFVSKEPSSIANYFPQVALKDFDVRDKDHWAESWEREANILAVMNESKHIHIVQCLAAIRRGEHRYLMFPWADGGTLRDFWVRIPKQGPQADLIRQAIVQLRGLADALHGFHSNNIGHGNLRPERILRFEDPGTDTDLGILKLADLGLAKQFSDVDYGTGLYDSPEKVPRHRDQLGYSNDLWSMGCIILEFTIWLLYGNDQLNTFHTHMQGGSGVRCRFFESHDREDAIVRPRITNEVVTRWMEYMEDQDPECTQESATRDLLEVVRERLLVDHFPQVKRWKRQNRATASELRSYLDAMLSKVDRPGYLATGKKRELVDPPGPFLSDIVSELPALTIGPSPPISVPEMTLKSGVLGRSIDTSDYALPSLKDWEYTVDNDFAGDVYDHFTEVRLLPPVSSQSRLCGRCSTLDFWQPGFVIEDTADILEDRSKRCAFCKLLWQAWAASDDSRPPPPNLHPLGKKFDHYDEDRSAESGLDEGLWLGATRLQYYNVRFKRVRSGLYIPGVPLPVMSIRRSLGKTSIF